MAEGTQLGKYTLQRKLATGGMAEIWLAEQRGPGGFAKELVVKRILPHLANDQKFVEMFLDEARLAAQLTHPNIVQIYDLGAVEGSYFIAMEYIRGHDLAQLREAAQAANTQLDPLASSRIVADACGGLDYAHTFTDSRGHPMKLVHRDVSPQNILVSEQGAVKLVDFGVAKAATSTHKTQTGAVKGKFAYMSPEQIKGLELDGRSDLFAMGIVLFELLTGRRPFGHDSELMAVTAIMHHPPPDIRELNPDIPQSLRDIVSRALEKDPAHRFQSAEEMQAALEGVLAASGQPVGRKVLANYLASLFSTAPMSLTSSMAAAATMIDSEERMRPTAQGVPPSLRHGPQEQPTAKRGSDPGLFSRPTRRVETDQAIAGADTQRMGKAGGVSVGLWVAILLVFLALAGAGYYLYTTITQNSGGSGDEPVAEGTGEDAGGTEPVEPDLGTAVVTGTPDAGVGGDEDAATTVATTPDAGEEADVAPAEADAGALTAADVEVPDALAAGDLPIALVDAELDALLPPDAVIAAADAIGQPDAGVIAVPDAGVITPPDAGVIAVPDAGEPEDAGTVAQADVAEADLAEAEADAAEAEDAGAVAVADVAATEDAGVAEGEDAEESDDTGTVAAAEDVGRVDEPRRRRDDEPGRIRFRISPPGRYEVSIDGEVIGRTPSVPTQTLEPGRYEVEVRRIRDGQSVTRRIRVEPGETDTVRIEVPR